MTDNVLRKIVYDAMYESHQVDAGDWGNVMDAAVTRLKEAQPKPGDQAKYVLEVDVRVSETIYRILKRLDNVANDFVNYHLVLETRTASTASTVMHALTEGRMEL